MRKQSLPVEFGPLCCRKMWVLPDESEKTKQKLFKKINMITTKNAWSILGIFFALFAIWAGYMSAHSKGQDQSGWMMMLFFCMALLLMCLEDPGWENTFYCVFCMVIGCLFAVHFIGGDAGVRALVHGVQWVGQKLLKGYADAFH